MVVAATPTVAERRGSLTRRGQALVEDDGFLKESFGEWPRLWREDCLSVPFSLPTRGWVKAEPEPFLLSPGRGPLVAVSLPWGMEAACHSGEGETGIRCREDCVRGGGHQRPWHRDRDQGLSSPDWRSEVGVLARDWAEFIYVLL